MIKALDHYYLRLRNKCYAVVVGNYHSTGYIVGYVKYCPVEQKTLWCDQYICYDRIVKYYMVEEVHSSTPWKTHVPFYGGETPVIPVSEVEKVLNPIDRLYEIMNRPGDELEYLVVKLIDESRFSSGVGVTGSILPSIHNVRVSDIDLIVYGLKNSVDVIEFIVENPSIFRGFNEEKLRAWCVRVSRATGLSPREVSRFYRRWRRGIYHGREYSFIYNDGIFKLLDNMSSWETIGVVKAEALFTGGFEALNYPTMGVIESWRYLDGANPRGDLEYVLSFEALYMPLFYEGGKAIVRGLLQYNSVDDTYRVLVGVKEEKTFIKPL